MQLLLFFHSIPLVLVLRYHLFFKLMNVMIRDTHHHSHLWTCDWQPPPFYIRLGEYLVDSWLHDAWLIAWQPSARLTNEPTIPWDQSLRGIGENWWRHSRESGRSNLVCGILSRIQWLNDCDVLQTPSRRGVSDRRKRITGFYFGLIENRQMDSRAVTGCVEHFH